MAWLVCVLVLTSASPSRAEPWLAVVSSGNCTDADLTTQARLLAERTRARVGAGLLSEGQLEQKLGPRPSHSPQELKRQIEAAQNLYYDAAYRRAEELLEAALIDIERLPPSAESLKLLTDARLVLSQALRSGRKLPEAEEAMQRILRLDPTFRLDPDLFPPAYRKVFESVRRTVQQAPLIPITVHSKQPGAAVYLDGRKLGQTPFVGRLPTGTYRLMLQRDGSASFPRTVTLQEETRLQIDLEFERAVRVGGTPCLADSGDEQVRLSNAVKLGALLGVTEVVVVRIERQQTGPAWVSAALVSVEGGQKIREGGLKLTDSGRPAEGTAELANFIHTGELGGRVVPRTVGTVKGVRGIPKSSKELSAAPLQERSERLELSPSEVSEEANPALQLQTAAHPTPPAVRAAWKEPVGWISASASVSLVVMGAVLQVQSLSSTAEMQRLSDSALKERGGLSADESLSLRRLEGQAAGQQQMAIGAFILGAALGGLSSYLLVSW